MPTWFQHSRSTTLCGMGCGVGLFVLILGLAFGKDEVSKLGMTIIGAAATIMGFLARSEHQHQVDAPALKAEVKAEVNRDVRIELARPPLEPDGPAGCA